MYGKPPPAPVKPGTVCEICGEALHCRWTDTHGIGACLTCGAPYTLFHYEKVDGENRLLNKPPELAIKKEWLTLTRQCWKETKSNVAPGAFNFGGSSYEVATPEEFDKNREWFKSHEAEWPKETPNP